MAGVYTMYLARIQDVRDFLLDDLYGIAPCSLPPLDTLVDTCFQYSILVNMLLVSTALQQQQQCLLVVLGVLIKY